MSTSSAPLITATLLTPPGVGAIAVIRVSGPQASAMVASMFRPAGGAGGTRPRGDRLRYGRLIDEAESIDDVIVAVRPSEKDGRETVDISSHGGTRIVARVLRELERRGATVRSGDEATESAESWPAANRIEQEANGLLAQARTRRAVRFLARQRAILPVALEEIGRSTDRPADALRPLSELWQRWHAYRYLIHGAEIAIVGPPNAGKSTLTNRLVGEERALASPWPGTTRDWTAHETAIEGVPLRLVDTAGIYDASEPVDQASIARGRDRTAPSDVTIAVIDGSKEPPWEFLRGPCARLTAERWIVAVNKSDLAPTGETGQWQGVGAAEVVSISALTGAGLDRLGSAILSVLGLAGQNDTLPSLFSERQAELVGALLAGSPGSGLELTGCIRLLSG